MSLKGIHPTSIYIQKFYQLHRVYQLHKVNILMLSATGKGTWSLPGTLKCLSQSPSPVSTQAHLFPKGNQYPNSCHQGLVLTGMLHKMDHGTCAVWSLTLCSTQCLWGSPMLFSLSALLQHISFCDHKVYAILWVHTWFLPVPSYHE